jgi:uncharacterized protein involved in exopolysaccharide biosynthesis
VDKVTQNSIEVDREELNLSTSLLPDEGDGARRETITERLRLLWDHRTFLYRAVGVGLVTATLIAFLLPKRYTSMTQLMPPDQGTGTGMALLAALTGKAGGSGGGGDSLGALGSDLLGFKTTGDLFIGILRSRTMEDDLIGKFDLRKIYGVGPWEDARKILEQQTEVSAERKSGIITIAVTDKSPQRAAGMAREYVAELNHIVTNLSDSSAHRERLFLEGRLDQVQQSLESAEKDFSQFASRNTAIDIQEQGKAMIQAGAALEGQLVGAQTVLQGLRQVYTDNNVRVRQAQARVDELRRQLEQIGGSAEDGAGTSGSDLGALYPSIRKLPLLGVSYADLYRRMKIQEAVYETLTREYELAKVEEVKETPSVQVLDPADVPERKSSPHRLIIMLVGTVLSFALGVAWVIGSAHWEEIEPGDPRKALVQEVLETARARLPRFSRNGAHPESDATVSRRDVDRGEDTPQGSK